MELSTEVKARHAVLSPLQVQFLEFIERHPEGLLRASYRAIENLDIFMRFPMQAWPLFLDEAWLRQITRANAALYHLVRAVPSRIFAQDPDRLAEFYGIDRSLAGQAAAALVATDGAQGALARGDFIDSPRGFLCVELNMLSNLGGWGSAVWAERYLRVPVIRRFLEECGGRVAARDTLYTLLCFLVGEALRCGLAEGGELNLCFLLASRAQLAPMWAEYVRRRFREARAACGGPAAGEVVLSLGDDLVMDSRGLTQRGKRIHAVVEIVDGQIPEAVFRAQVEGVAHVYNGSMGRVLSDKLNLALLSQYQDSDLFSFEERNAIAAHVPWTRRIAAELTDWNGERVYLPDLLLRERERLVVKIGFSKGGHGVYVGRCTPQPLWETAVARALEEGTWVVQEHLECSPYLFQGPGDGCCLHDVVWGIFVCGDTYGGGFLRMVPQGQAGVINAAQGATEGILFEVKR
jgi:hypothetical protein